MKIYTKVELLWDGERYRVGETDSYEWEGEVAHAGGGGGQQQTTQKTEPWEKQAPYLEDLFKRGQQWADQPGSDTTLSQNATQTAIQGYGNAASGVENYMGSIRDSNQSYANGAFLDESLLSPTNNPAFQQYMDMSNQSIANQYTESFLPALTGGAAQAGNIGSSRQGVQEAIGGGKYLDAIQRNSAQMTNTAYGQGLNATMQAQSLAPGMAGTFGIAPGMQTAAADLQYGLDTEADQAALQRLQAYQGLIGGGYGGTQTSTGPGTKSGGLSGALGGAATGAALGAQFGPVGATYAGIGGLVGGAFGYFS